MPLSQLNALAEATRRLVRTVDALDSDALAAPSLLPGWSRAHVVAHVALNGEALAGVLEGLARGVRVPMYSSVENRDADIDQLAARDAATLRDRLLVACTRFNAASMRTSPNAWGTQVDRVPGGPTFPAGAIVAMRRREVEIHHADLNTGYGVDDWPEDFLDHTFNRVVDDRSDGPAMLLRTPDGDVPVGSGEVPVVSGSRADLTWWLLGRGGGEGLECEGALPALGAWR